MSRTVAVVPIRSTRQAKSRLAPLFDAETRSGIVRQLLRHVVGALGDSGAVDEIVVVTMDPDSLPETVTCDALVRILVQAGSGLDAAVEIGRARALTVMYERMLVVLPDLPLLRADDVQEMLAETAPVVIARDRHGTGTNALAVDLTGEGRAFRFAFGSDSAARHVDEADGLGLPWTSVDLVGLRHDLDTPDDWATLPERVRAALVTGVETPELMLCLCE